MVLHLQVDLLVDLRHSPPTATSFELKHQPDLEPARDPTPDQHLSHLLLQTPTDMRASKTIRRLAVATAILPRALAVPQAGITVARPPVAWVTVDASGSAQTITPGVITTQGHLATVSEAPSSLRSTATYTLSPEGHASTYTGLAPVASATGKDGSLAGVFPACDGDANVGPVEPFCLPRDGSELQPGKTYYSTPSHLLDARPLSPGITSTIH